MHQEPTKSPHGYYVFAREKNFIWWKAWASWLQSEVGQSHVPETLQAFTQFPPETQEMADVYAEYIRKIREKVGNPKPVPRPKPWRRWSPTEMNRLEREETETKAPPRRRTEFEIDRVTRAARARYPRAFGKYVAPGNRAERPAIAYTDSDPDTISEMRACLAEKIADRAQFDQPAE